MNRCTEVTSRRLTFVCLAVIATSRCFSACTSSSGPVQAGTSISLDTPLRISDDDDYLLGPVRLPALPPEVRDEDEPFMSALDLTRSFLMNERPEAPRELSERGFERFVQERFTEWVTARARSLRELDEKLDPLKESALVGQRVVAQTLIALCLAKFAEQIASMPFPQPVQDNPRARVLQRDAFVRMAHPLYTRSRDSFGACAAATSQEPSLDRYRHFCDEGTMRLQNAPRPLN